MSLSLSSPLSSLGPASRPVSFRSTLIRCWRSASCLASCFSASLRRRSSIFPSSRPAAGRSRRQQRQRQHCCSESSSASLGSLSSGVGSIGSSVSSATASGVLVLRGFDESNDGPVCGLAIVICSLSGVCDGVLNSGDGSGAPLDVLAGP